MLEVRALSATYGQHPALQDVSLGVAPGEIVVILGANGAGKSTLLRAIAGICEGHVSGEVTLDGDPLTGHTSDEIVERGVALVPEGRGIFGDLTVRENLLLGAYSARARADEQANLDGVLRLFPKLQERQSQIARTMSGGEQQMVAIGRAMMSAPKILMLDEPSLGLSPLLCKELFANLAHVKDLGIGVLLVEQNAKQSLAIADRGYLLENTRITHEDTAERLASDPAVQKAYLGAGSKAAPKLPAEPAPKPDLPPMQARPQPRRTADQQSGLDIEAIVQNAARISATPKPAAPRVSQSAVDRAAASGVAAVLQDIERAAAEAGKRVARPSAAATARRTDAIPTQYRRDTDVEKDTENDTPPPVIEVYRKPRVEVYRRRPSGQFERD